MEVGELRVALPFQLVQRVTLPSVVKALPPTPHVPPFVTGVATSVAGMVTVIDAGMLLGVGPTPQTMKTRLVVLGEGSMLGFALLVARVHDPIEAQEQAAVGWSLISDHDLAARLARPQEIE
jgi:chemotaxis signal transduction protein